MAETNAVARIQVTVEVESGPYGNEWKLEDIYKNAERTATTMLENGNLKAHQARVVKIERVEAVIVRRRT